MVESGDLAERDIVADEGDGSPVCLRCMRPVDPVGYYCPYCEEASGQFTQYIPFVNIRWQVDVWGRIWRGIWSREVSIPGRLFRLFMIIWCVPIMLIGLFFGGNKKTENEDNRQDEDD